MHSLNFTPLRDLIVVKPDKPVDKIGSIYIPESAQQKGPSEPGDGAAAYNSFSGTVVAVGRGDKKPDGSRHVMYTKVGDKVVFPRRASAPGGAGVIVLDGEEYLVMHEQQSAFAILGGKK